MTLTILKLEIRRMVRDRVRLFFTAIMPAFFYVIFGAAQSYGSIKVAHGNVAMMIMVAMAAYGAVAATASLGAATAIERATGWGRQLGLTPLGPHWVMGSTSRSRAPWPSWLPSSPSPSSRSSGRAQMSRRPPKRGCYRSPS